MTAREPITGASCATWPTVGPRHPPRLHRDRPTRRPRRLARPRLRHHPPTCRTRRRTRPQPKPRECLTTSGTRRPHTARPAAVASLVPQVAVVSPAAIRPHRRSAGRAIAGRGDSAERQRGCGSPTGCERPVLGLGTPDTVAPRRPTAEPRAPGEYASNPAKHLRFYARPPPRNRGRDHPPLAAAPLRASTVTRPASPTGVHAPRAPSLRDAAARPCPRRRAPLPPGSPPAVRDRRRASDRRRRSPLSA